MLAQATSSPDYVNYITYIFSSPQAASLTGINENEYPTVRFAAAVNVKTKIAIAYSTISPQSLAFIKSAALVTLRDADRNVSRAAGNVITAMVLHGGLLAWPEIVNELLTTVANTNGDVPMSAREAAMDTLYKVCEDNRKVLDRDYQGQRPLNFGREFTHSDRFSQRHPRFLAIQTPGIDRLARPISFSVVQNCW